jgi:prepilin-type N-terminal cleavage/methylation domain-containing protein
MKPIRKPSRAAFTLIELLVVISIIAVLASLAIPTANVVMRKAKEAQTRALIAGLLAGVKTYQTEYNRLPDPTVVGQGSPGYSTDQKLALDGTGNPNLLSILHPDTTQAPPYANPRRLDFYDPPPAKNGANGAYSANNAPPYALNDSWSSASYSQVISVALDYGGDNAVDAALDPTMGGANIQTTAIAWSTGQPISPKTANSGTDPVGKNYFICSWR